MENTTSFGPRSDSFEQMQLRANLEFAKFQLAKKYQAQKDAQYNKLKSIALVVGGAILILAMLLGIIAWCLHIGKEQFVIDFLKYSLYPLSAGGGFWAGRISANHTRENPFSPIQPQPPKNHPLPCNLPLASAV